MELRDDICYQAILTRDARFDGAFFVGVSSTGIYCRPICAAKTPRSENCTFYRSAALAERSGYRPCLRCRPELAPGNSQVDATNRLAAAAAARIEDGALVDGGVDELAAELGVSGRHLRRIVEREFGVTPVELAQTSRLLMAKRLLTDTDLPVIEIAFASGFSSLRRFNALFSERYRLNPTSLRKVRSTRSEVELLVCEVGYGAPLDWETMIGFLRGRVCKGVECVDGDTYMRTLAVGKLSGWLSVSPGNGRDALRVQVSLSLAPALRQVIAAVKRVFDLHAMPLLISAHLGELAAASPGMRVPGTFDTFEMAVRAILGQQVSVAGATTVAGRYQQAFGTPIVTPFESLHRITVVPEKIAATDPAELVSLGILRSRANTIVGLAKAVTDGKVALRPGVDVERAMSLLKEIPGIGEWTAQYIAMRALGWPDAFPHTDLGVMKALGERTPKRILEIAEPWRPWRSYATMHLWKSLETTP